MRRRYTRMRPPPYSGVESSIDFAEAEPDRLRDVVRDALLSLTEPERFNVCSRLLGELKKAGLRIRPCLLMLGVSAATTEELTASEIAALIRYVRLTQPGIVAAMTALLRDLLQVPTALRASDRAA